MQYHLSMAHLDDCWVVDEVPDPRQQQVRLETPLPGGKHMTLRCTVAVKGSQCSGGLLCGEYVDWSDKPIGRKARVHVGNIWIVGIQACRSPWRVCLQQQQAVLKAEILVISSQRTQLFQPLRELGVGHVRKRRPKAIADHLQPRSDKDACTIGTVVHRHLRVE